MDLTACPNPLCRNPVVLTDLPDGIYVRCPKCEMRGPVGANWQIAVDAWERVCARTAYAEWVTELVAAANAVAGAWEDDRHGPSTAQMQRLAAALTTPAGEAARATDTTLRELRAVHRMNL